MTAINFADLDFFAELVNLGEFSDNAVNSESVSEIGMFSFASHFYCCSRKFLVVLLEKGQLLYELLIMQNESARPPPVQLMTWTLDGKSVCLAP